jgi:branched-chain amino acid transport system substrate-binding protein
MGNVKTILGRLGAALALSAGLALAAGPANAQEKTPLQFGLAMPLSGSQALYGKDQVQAAQWAVKDINDKGGVDGHPLKMTVLDSQADPQLGIQAANKLIAVEHVPVFISAWSSVVKAIAPVANDAKVVQLSVGANSPDIARLGDYTYTTFPLADVDIRALAKYEATDLGKKRAAVLYINNETGTVAAKVYKDVFTENGGEVVDYAGYDPNASDWTGLLLKVRAANPDVVHIQGLVADTPQIVAQMRQLGLNMTVSSYSAIYNQRFLEQLGSAAEGIIATSLAPGLGEPAVADYVQRWNKEIGRVPNGLPYTEYLYDAPYLIKDVFAALLKKNEKLTGENFRQAMLDVGTFKLPLTGTTTISSDHTVNKPVYLVQVKDGKWQQIAEVK